MNNKLKFKFSTQINIIGFILVMMAGWIDTVGVNLFLTERSSFMSGRGAILGYFAYKGNLKAFISILLVIISFIIGACMSTKITKKTGLTGGLCFSGILIIIASFCNNYNKITMATILIPMAMGSQNAATSLTPINRTTHLTGPTTDIGINIAERNWNTVIFWILRWIAFPLGAIIGLSLVHMVNNQIIHTSTTLFLPAIIIILTGIIQKLTFDIPLLDEVSELQEKEIINF